MYLDADVENAGAVRFEVALWVKFLFISLNTRVVSSFAMNVFQQNASKLFSGDARVSAMERLVWPRRLMWVGHAVVPLHFCPEAGGAADVIHFKQHIPLGY